MWAFIFASLFALTRGGHDLVALSNAQGCLALPLRPYGNGPFIAARFLISVPTKTARLSISKFVIIVVRVAATTSTAAPMANLDNNSCRPTGLASFRWHQ